MKKVILAALLLLAGVSTYLLYNGQNKDKEESVKKETSKADKEVDIEDDGFEWHYVQDSQNVNGIISKGEAEEVNIALTKEGNPVVAYENDEENDRIRVKIFENKEWRVLSDEKYPRGMISSGKSSNPTIAAKGEDIYVSFVEQEKNKKAVVMRWNKDEKSWKNLNLSNSENSHEPNLTFDKNEKYLYAVYSKKSEKSGLGQAVIKSFNGQEWKEISGDSSFFYDNPGSTVDEFDIKKSSIDNSIYIAYEEQPKEGDRIIRVKKWDGLNWKDLDGSEYFKKRIGNAGGSSPSIDVAKEDTLSLAFIDKKEDFLRVFQYKNGEWLSLGNNEGAVNDEVSGEPYVASFENALFVGYSEYKENVYAGERNNKTSRDDRYKDLWRVRVMKHQDGKWSGCSAPNFAEGYISEGDGKGDPAMAGDEDELFVVFSDEDDDYKARVMKYSSK